MLFRKYSFVSCLIFLMVNGLSGSAERASASDEVDFIFYNIQFLPGPASFVNKRKQPDYRANRIGEEMAKFDVVGLCELFDEGPREKVLAPIRKAWGEDFHVAVHPKPDDRFNGGLVIASRFPIIEENYVYFENYSKVEDWGVRADGFAAKGVLHARIKRSAEADDNDFIDVFVTHLEARDDKLRPAQFRELATFVKTHSSPDHPTILAGDMNTKGTIDYREDPKAQYTDMLSTLRGVRPEGLVDLWAHLYPDQRGGTKEQESIDIGHRIDYIFMSNPTDSKLALEPVKMWVDIYPDPEVFALSDHNAVAATFKWPNL